MEGVVYVLTGLLESKGNGEQSTEVCICSLLKQAHALEFSYRLSARESASRELYQMQINEMCRVYSGSWQAGWLPDLYQAGRQKSS